MTEELQLTAKIAEYLRTRYFGKYRALVSEIADPENLGRIKANVPAVLGDKLSPWAMPAVPSRVRNTGYFSCPKSATASG